MYNEFATSGLLKNREQNVYIVSEAPNFLQDIFANIKDLKALFT